MISTPHFHLFAEARNTAELASAWHFTLQAVDGSLHLDVVEEEPEAPTERLELLAVVRGLEALDQPSRVTLLTPSRHVFRGLRDGLPLWRESGWMWESFGQMTPIKHEDLWRRVDHALSYHRVQCRSIRVDAAVTSVPSPNFTRRKKRSGKRRSQGETPRVVLSQRERIDTNERLPGLSWRQRLAGVLVGLGEAIAPQSLHPTA